MPEVKKAEFDPNVLQDMLPIYYKRLFPHKQFYRWLSYNLCKFVIVFVLAPKVSFCLLLAEDGIFSNREFSFTLQDDVYIRYLSFENQSELEKEICSRNPFKIDIGPVLNIRPKNHRSNPSVKPMQRELVFDIDMTDYDEVRTCCSEANICNKCWKFMSIACRVLDAALREDFGFEHILWVFSGRRGIHCWVCDKEARHLDSKGRGAIADYLQLTVSGGEGSVTKVTLYDKQHNSIRRARGFVEPMFNEVILEDQNMFGTQAGVDKLLKMVSDESYRQELKKQLLPGDSKAVWSTFCAFFESLRVTGQLRPRSRNIIEEVKLAMMYPRLDINVSKGTNHLLKSPFCVHPKTGKVCVPFNPNLVQKFDPMAVPTITLLLDEINAFDKKQSETDEDKSRIKDYKKTSMFKSTMLFEEFLRKLDKVTKSMSIVVSDKKMEF
jgi:DNA primase small subunit